MVKLRIATIDDAARLFAWRRDASTREASLDQKLFSFKEHLKWFNSVPGSQMRLFVANDTSRGVWIGTARLDVNKNTATVSITVDPLHRGRGYASLILQEMVAIAKDLRIESLVAKIKATNVASLRAFWAIGFRLKDEKDDTIELVLPVASLPK